ncbi:hypothetical protein N9L06_04810 [Mariniblastus sp.]|nr:hypothetical protein [Mariniblastus sp.]
MKDCLLFRVVVCVSFGLANYGSCPLASSQIVTDVIAFSGDPVPDGNGVLSSFAIPVLNDSGQVAFTASLAESVGVNNNNAILLSNVAGDLVQIGRSGDTVPSGDNVFSGFASPALNDSGDLAFRGIIGGASGVYLGREDNSLTRIIRFGDAEPGGNSTIGIVYTPALNSAGQTAFFGTPSVFRGNRFHLLSDRNANVVPVVREGDPAFNDDGTFVDLSLFPDQFDPAINDSGQVAFSAVLADVSGGGPFGAIGVFIGDGSGTPSQVALTGEIVPDGDGVFFSFEQPALNDLGEVAFVGDVRDTSAFSGVFHADENSNVTQIARVGEAVPDGNGTFSGFSREISLNDAGQALFFGFAENTAGIRQSNGLYIGDERSDVTQIARAGTTVPSGVGVFFDFLNPALNENGQAAFKGIVSNIEIGDESGIYLYDDELGLTEVARVGDSFLGSTIINLDFSGSSLNLGNERSGLNDTGQVAYRFTLADGRGGIAIASAVPEPNSRAVGVLASGLLLMRRRR